MKRRGSENRSRPRRRRRGGGSVTSLSDLGAVAPVVTAPLTRRVLGLPWWAWAGLAAGGGLTAWAVLAATKASAMALDPQQQVIFKQALPAYAQPYADAILAVASARGADPFAIYALGDRESLWGTASAYKQQTGDWAARDRTLAAAQARPDIYKIVSTYSRVIDAKTGETREYAKVMPADGLGWGRGLMQIDWEQQFDWVSRNDWRDTFKNIDYGVTYLMSLLKLFGGTSGIGTVATGGKVYVSASYATWLNGLKKRTDLVGGTYNDPRPLAGVSLQAAAVAAYNTGPGNVIRNLALGLPAEASTSGGDYTADAMRRQGEMLARYQQAGGTPPGTAVA